jgi:pilus assembly protein CpaE
VALFRRSPAERELTNEVSDPRERLVRIAYAAAAFDGGAPAETLKTQFPQVLFEPALGDDFTEALARVDVVIATADGGKPQEIERLCADLRRCEKRGRVIVFLSQPKVETTRRIVREGAGDVLLAPISEPALAATLERILAGVGRPASDGGREGHVVSLLKAGGGVGATALGAQVAAMVAESGQAPRVCLVDLDVQFGMAAVYLDVTDSITMGEVLAAAGSPAEIGFATQLAPHASGARVLAAPPAFLPLEAISLDLVDGLISALRRDFDLVLLDLPSAWTAWTNRALSQSDQIVLVTNLSVPHAHLTHRQFGLLRTQGLERVPVTLVCNRYGGDAPAGISLRAVASAIGRDFDVQIPEDRKLMGEAVNQGAVISAIRRGSKLEKGLRQLVSEISAARAAKHNARRA